MTLSLYRNCSYYLILSLILLPRELHQTRHMVKDSSSRINPIQLRRLPGFLYFRANSSLFNVYLMHWLAFCGLLFSALLKIGGVEPNPGPSKTICGSCSKTLGNSTKTKPLLWCTICGWVHFDCSGLASVRDYDDKD